jgi:hypothetical protein
LRAPATSIDSPPLLTFRRAVATTAAKIVALFSGVYPMVSARFIGSEACPLAPNVAR